MFEIIDKVLTLHHHAGVSHSFPNVMGSCQKRSKVRIGIPAAYESLSLHFYTKKLFVKSM